MENEKENNLIALNSAVETAKDFIKKGHNIISSVELGIADGLSSSSYTGQGIVLIGIAPENVLPQIAKKFEELKNLLSK